MATYPTGVYAPASKSAGQTIQASFFNDPDAEITAVEDALKNGITHAVSIAGTLTVSTGGLAVSTGSVNIGGPSSLATLNVTGGSTLAALTVASTASFASSVTFAGPVTFSSGVTFATPQNFVIPSVRLSLSGNAAISSNVSTGLSWGVQDWTNAGMHSTSANSSRITFAHSTGLYAVGANVFFNSTAAANLELQLRLNDTSGIAQVAVNHDGVSTGVGLCVTSLQRVTSTTDYVTVTVRNSAVADTILSASTRGLTLFWAHKVSN